MFGASSECLPRGPGAAESDVVGMLVHVIASSAATPTERSGLSKSAVLSMRNVLLLDRPATRASLQAPLQTNKAVESDVTEGQQRDGKEFSGERHKTKRATNPPIHSLMWPARV